MQNSQNSERAHPGEWPRFLAWFFAGAAIFIVVVKHSLPLIAQDVWWHMVLGRWVLETGNLIVDHALFTWSNVTAAVNPYNTWLADVALALIDHTFGKDGLAALQYVVHGGFLALAAYFAIQRGVVRNPIAWVIIILGGVLAFAVLLVQPELFSFVFMSVIVWLYFFIRNAGDRAWALCYLFPAIIIVWENTHGAFVLSALFFLAIGVGELLNTALGTAFALPRKLRTHLFISLALCLPALLVNPFGYALPLGILHSSIPGGPELTALSHSILMYFPTFMDNESPDFALDNVIMAMVLFILLIGQALRNKKVNWVIIFAFLSYSFLFMQFVRATYPLVPVFVFSSLELLSYKQHSWAWPRATVAKVLITLICVACVSLVGWRTIRPAACNENLWSCGSVVGVPIEETNYISQMLGVKRIGNTYTMGGYLMYRLWPNQLPMIDARYFPFRLWFDQYLRFEHGQDVQQFIDGHPADVWLIPHDRPELMLWFLSRPQEWAPLFFGPIGVVFGPNRGAADRQPLSAGMIRFGAFGEPQSSFVTAIIMRNWPVAEQIRAQTVALAERHPFCIEPYQALLTEMSNLTAGVHAFDAGHYESAASFLKQTGHLMGVPAIVGVTLTILAKHAWDNHDYARARAMAMDALHFERSNATMLYNAAVTDWQYRRTASKNNQTPASDAEVTWQFLASLLLNAKGKVPDQYQFTIGVLTAMQQGTLVNPPDLIAPKR